MIFRRRRSGTCDGNSCLLTERICSALKFQPSFHGTDRQDTDTFILKQTKAKQTFSIVTPRETESARQQIEVVCCLQQQHYEPETLRHSLRFMRNWNHLVTQRFRRKESNEPYRSQYTGRVRVRSHLNRRPPKATWMIE